MCGIFGIAGFSEKDDKWPVFRDLLSESCRRGTDAAGVGVFSSKNKTVFKREGSGRKMLDLFEFKQKVVSQIDKSRILIGQTRLATNGSPKIYENNQPIEVEDLTLVHNGIIINSRELSKKYRISEKQSDSKILAEILRIESKKTGSMRQALVKISGQIAGTMNVIVVSKYSGKLSINAVTNNGSLYVGICENFLIFASEKFFLNRVAIKHNLEIKVLKIKANTGFEIDEGGAREEYILRKPTISHESTILSRPSQNVLKHKFDKKIKETERCVRCLLPVNTPNISFDDKGICSFCRSHKKIIYGRDLELKEMVEKYKNKDGGADCIIAFSGGRDSAYGLHYLVKELGMHPVAVTFDWGMISDIGRRNQARLLGSLGIEQIIVSADLTKVRSDIKKNLEAWLLKPDLGMVPLLMQADKVTEYYVDKIKEELELDLVFFCRGNELEREEFKAGYCGVKNADPGGVIHNYSVVDKLRLLWYYLRQFATNPHYLNSSLLSSLLGYLVTYVVPHDYIYLWHYIKWEENKIIKTLVDEYGWEDDGETGITWRIDDGSPAFYNYLYRQIQGFTENDSFRSNQIREGLLTRDEAKNIVERENKPRYAALQWYFETIGVDGDRVLSIIDRVEKKY
ncbi:MAG TPA: hypothetical protein VN174_01635 [Candidatus Methanoperedens sp.]|nr:hypothetical protein [Candidatus Methanoperedens sp.]